LGFVPLPNLLASHFGAISETQQNGLPQLKLLALTSHIAGTLSNPFLALIDHQRINTSSTLSHYQTKT
jgi:hypothetical protein